MGFLGEEGREIGGERKTLLSLYAA